MNALALGLLSDLVLAERLMEPCGDCVRLGICDVHADPEEEFWSRVFGEQRGDVE